MRIVRLCGLVLAVFTAGLLLATPAGAQPPAKLTDHITDSTAALTDTGRATVNSAIDRLYRDRHIQLWVVYVDNFNRFKPDNWAKQTRDASGMGDSDVLLAVGTNTKLYDFDVPPKAQDLTPAELNSLQSNKIEPAINAKDWSGAAVAAANGLNKSASPPSSTSSSKRIWLWIAIGVGVVVLAVVVLLLLRARRRRRTARRVDSAGGQANIDAGDLGQSLSTADARVRQISDYASRHRTNIGAEAKDRLEEAKHHLAAARGKQGSNAPEAIAHANSASVLAAQAQTMANADVQAAHRKR
jgi:uncharacterized membrane protein YgcG